MKVSDEPTLEAEYREAINIESPALELTCSNTREWV